MSLAHNDALIEQIVSSQREIATMELDLRQARRLHAVLRFLWVTSSIVAVAIGVVTMTLSAHVDLAPFWTGAVVWVVATGLVSFVVWGIHSEGSRAYTQNPRKLEIELDRLYELQALASSGERLPLDVRQYVFRGEMQRAVGDTRKRSGRYRRVNNAFQTAIIIGSLATTTVASLNTGEGLLKWVAVGLSFLVGISAGFTGYFKYRERAFYLRQAADEIEEQLNAFELGLPPYDRDSESERIARLTATVESIRVAQQRREQQLDQPNSPRDET